MFLTLALPLLGKEAQLEVLLFLATECPISNRYIPELNRIATEYAARGVKFRICLPEPGLTAVKAAIWAKDYQIGTAWELDAAQQQVKRAGATVTPQAAVFAGGRLVYRGRIDDRYVSWGKSSAVPSRRDLCEVLDACLRGEVPALRTTKSWGCFIESRKPQ